MYTHFVTTQLYQTQVKKLACIAPAFTYLSPQLRIVNPAILLLVLYIRVSYTTANIPVGMNAYNPLSTGYDALAESRHRAQLAQAAAETEQLSNSLTRS